MDLQFWDHIESVITQKLEPLVSSGKFTIDLDGKIRLHRKLVIDIPWVFVRGREFGDCYMFKDIWFEHFKIIPSFCQAYCYKVVIKPRTVKELFETYETLRAMNVPSKAGLETRAYQQGHYRAFIYCNGLQDGERRFKEARAAIPADIPVVLKRGCTEFEYLMPSDKWHVPPEQSAFEQKLMAIFQTEPIAPFQPQWIINAIKRRWIAHAYKIGDETYKEVIGDPTWTMAPPTVLYQPQNEPVVPQEPEKKEEPDSGVKVRPIRKQKR